VDCAGGVLDADGCPSAHSGLAGDLLRVLTVLCAVRDAEVREIGDTLGVCSANHRPALSLILDAEFAAMFCARAGSLLELTDAREADTAPDPGPEAVPVAAAERSLGAFRGESTRFGAGLAKGVVVGARSLETALSFATFSTGSSASIGTARQVRARGKAGRVSGLHAGLLGFVAEFLSGSFSRETRCGLVAGVFGSSFAPGDAALADLLFTRGRGGCCLFTGARPPRELAPRRSSDRVRIGGSRLAATRGGEDHAEGQYSSECRLHGALVTVQRCWR